jgi:dTDP-6-deoxy-L-talose 4-dehydrogenase (NAD+)
MKILLTGPTGFIGSAFTRLALERGHQVAGLLLPNEPVPAERPAGPNLVWLRGTLDQAPWNDIAGFRPDVCVHAAWITTPGVYLETPENERFRDASLEFIRKAAGLGARHVVSLGTCIEYQVTHQPLSEESPIAPTTLYARCKNDLRLALESDAKSGKFSFCWTRIFYPYGPREHPSRLCSSIILKLARDEKIVLRTPDSTKDYIYIDDLAAALLTVLEKRFEGIINLGTGTGVSVKRIAQSIAKLMGKPELIEEKNPPEVDPAGYVVADASRLHRLGWHPAYDLERGLRDLLIAHRFGAG